MRSTATVANGTGHRISRLRGSGIALLLVAAIATGGCASRRPGQIPTPGFNSYSPSDDVEIGRQYSAEIDKQVPLANNQQLQGYVSRLGQALSRQPEAGDYPYSFKMINDPSINAFALPGGPIYIHSGILTNAASEGQIAGVIAHEISHVALRHGTNQASKAQLFDLGGALASVAIGNQSTAAQIGQLGLGLGLTSVLLRYSRSAESDADALGARMMAGAGYDPVEMARFFETLQRQSGGGGTDFFASHPSPGNRVAAVSQELEFLPSRGYSAGTGQFADMKRAAQALPAPPQRQAAR